MFVYQRGMSTGGDVALDDITIQPSSCYSEPSVLPSNNSSNYLYLECLIRSKTIVVLPGKKLPVNLHVRYLSPCFAVSVDALSAGLAVGLTLLIGSIITMFLFMLNRKWKLM